MATLDQIYRAYLNEDPNVSQMVYDPFSWNIEQTFDDTVDDTTTTLPVTGGITNAYIGGGDGANTRLPSSFKRTEGSYQGPGTIGLPGNVLQRGPGRQFTGMEADIVGDPRGLYDDEDSSWFKQFREGLTDNPLMQGVMAMAAPFKKGFDAISQALPVNERAILENEALGSGIALDDIGRVVRQEGLDYDTAENIFAGYNYAQIDEDTFEKRRKAIKNMSPEGYAKRLKAINDAEKMWRLNKEKTAGIVYKKEKEKGITPLSDQIAINKAKQNFKNIVSQAEDKGAASTVEDTAAMENIISAPAHPGLYTPIHGSGGQGGVSTAGQATGVSRSAPQRDYSTHSAYGLNRGGRVKYGNGGIVDLL